MNDGPLGEVEAKGLDSSFFSSSLSFGEYAAPNGLCVSRGDVVFGLAGLAFKVDCDGGVDPDENLELRLDIQEFRRPMGLGSLLREAGEGVDAFCSSVLSAGCGFDSPFGTSFWGSFFGSEEGGEGDGCAGLLLDRFLRCDLGGEDAGCSVPDPGPGLSLVVVVEFTDFVRDR
jgi:hypothetical protein